MDGPFIDVRRHAILSGARKRRKEGIKNPAADLGISTAAISCFEHGRTHSERTMLYYITRYGLTVDEMEYLCAQEKGVHGYG